MLLLNHRHLLYTTTKMHNWNTVLQQTMSTSTNQYFHQHQPMVGMVRPSIRINRFFSNATLLHSVFGQAWSQLKHTPPFLLRQKDRAWHVNFVGENSVDVGGPYREVLSEIIHELEEKHVQMFVATPNQRNNMGLLRDKFVPNTNYQTDDHFSMYRFIGQLMGESAKRIYFFSDSKPNH